MNKPGFGEFCWNELSTPDVHQAKAFYSQMLGWEFVDHDMGDVTYTMIRCNGKDFGGIWQIPKDQQAHVPPHWMGYISVENIEETVKKAEALGASIKMPVTPAGDAGKFAIIVDPTGAHIAFWQSLVSRS